MYSQQHREYNMKFFKNFSFFTCDAVNKNVKKFPLTYPLQAKYLTIYTQYASKLPLFKMQHYHVFNVYPIIYVLSLELEYVVCFIEAL